MPCKHCNNVKLYIIDYYKEQKPVQLYPTSEENRLPANLIREWSKQDISDQHTRKEQGPSQVHFVGLMFNQVPLQEKSKKNLKPFKYG